MYIPNMNDEIYCLYDVVDKKDIFLHKIGIVKQCKQLKISTGVLYYLLSGRSIHMDGRYILPENKDKIFTLVDFETGKEYDCITNKTILIYLGLSLKKNKRTIHAVHYIKTGRQNYGSVAGHLFYLKGNTKLPCCHNLLEHLPKVQNARRYHSTQRKIRQNLCRRLSYSIKRQNGQKSDHTMSLAGCSMDFLMNYLKSKWLPEMNWDNYGSRSGWQIDHIIPCSAFDMLDCEQQKKCFHYTNLQPLWAEDNSSKGNKMPNGERAHIKRNEAAIDVPPHLCPPIPSETEAVFQNPPLAQPCQQAEPLRLPE
jgi:hypothetical protein